MAFGLNPTLLTSQPPPTPSDFIGYPEVVAYFEHLFESKKEVNAACPGETSTSFIVSGAPDYGCNSPGPQGQPPFKTWIGLHTNYRGTQLDFALSELSSNKHINLVTLQIGSNDFFILARDCASASDPQLCINTGMPALLQTLGQNLTHILAAMRSGAHYNGTIILVGYYAPSAQLIPVATALNSVILAVGAQFQTRYADSLTAFQLAALPYGGDVCKAGLLIHLDPSTCDIHPSPKGRDILAATVLVAH